MKRRRHKRKSFLVRGTGKVPGKARSAGSFTSRRHSRYSTRSSWRWDKDDELVDDGGSATESFAQR